MLGTLNVIRHSVDFMMEKKLEANQERGVIVNTASVAAFDGQIGQVCLKLQLRKIKLFLFV